MFSKIYEDEFVIVEFESSTSSYKIIEIGKAIHDIGPFCNNFFDWIREGRLAIKLHQLSKNIPTNEVLNKSAYKQAQQLITGSKREAYGGITDSFERIAKIWSGILGINISAKKVALLMIGLKTYRESHRHQPDNVVDLFGYSICLEHLVKDDNS